MLSNMKRRTSHQGRKRCHGCTCTGQKRSCKANITPYEQRTKSFLIRNGRHGCRAPASYHKESLQLVNSQLSHSLFSNIEFQLSVNCNPAWKEQRLKTEIWISTYFHFTASKTSYPQFFQAGSDCFFTDTNIVLITIPSRRTVLAQVYLH